MAKQIEKVLDFTGTNKDTDKTTATSVLKSDFSSNYPATIAGQTARIADAHAIINAKAREMGLQIQNSEGDSKPSDKTGLTGTSKIMDTASAINSIIIQTPSAKLWDAEGNEDTTVTENVIVVPVEVKNAAGEEYVSAGTIPAGYYKNNVNIYPVLNTTTTTNKRINVLNDVGTLNEKSGQLKITVGYDYFTKDASYDIKSGNVTAVTSNGPTATNNTITFNGGETSEGWVSDDVTKPATITLTKSTVGTTDTLWKNADEESEPEFTITPNDTILYISKETWTGKGIKIANVSAGEGLIDSSKIDSIVLDTTIKTASSTYTPISDSSDSNNENTYFSSINIDVTNIISKLIDI